MRSARRPAKSPGCRRGWRRIRRRARSCSICRRGKPSSMPASRPAAAARTPRPTPCRGVGRRRRRPCSTRRRAGPTACSWSTPGGCTRRDRRWSTCSPAPAGARRRAYRSRRPSRPPIPSCWPDCSKSTRRRNAMPTNRWNRWRCCWAAKPSSAEPMPVTSICWAKRCGSGASSPPRGRKWTSRAPPRAGSSPNATRWSRGSSPPSRRGKPPKTRWKAVMRSSRSRPARTNCCSSTWCSCGRNWPSRRSRGRRCGRPPLSWVARQMPPGL